MRLKSVLHAVLAVALVVPAAASADTTLGTTTQPTGSTPAGCPQGPDPVANELLFEFGSSPFSGPLSVPSSTTPQAVTQWAVNAAGLKTAEQLTLVVLSIDFSGAEPTLDVVGTDTETLTPPASAADDVEQFTLAQAIPVQSEDLIAQYAPGSTDDLTCYWSGGPNQTGTVEGLPMDSPPTAGEQLTPASGIDESDADLNLSATLTPVSYDAGVSMSSGPSIATVGQPAVITATVTNNGPLAGPITFTDPIPNGLTVLATGAGSGSCSTSTAVNIVTCNLADVPVHQSVKVVIVVSPTAAGKYKDTGAVALTGGGADPNAANNSAATTLTASPAGAPTKCVVPKLGGAPLSLAKKILPVLGCKVGKVKQATSKSVAKGDVISTGPKAGTYAVGDKVSLTVSKGKPKSKPKKKK